MHIHQTSTQFPYLYFAIFVYTVMYCEFCWFFTFCIINPIPSCRIQEIWSYSENHVIPSALCSTTNDQTSMISFSNLLHNMINTCVFSILCINLLTLYPTHCHGGTQEFCYKTPTSTCPETRQRLSSLAPADERCVPPSPMGLWGTWYWYPMVPH